MHFRVLNKSCLKTLGKLIAHYLQTVHSSYLRSETYKVNRFATLLNPARTGLNTLELLRVGAIARYSSEQVSKHELGQIRQIHKILAVYLHVCECLLLLLLSVGCF
jgi:uncharacterized membrane protein YgaE (UPF0421/DUF939 family)